jgi:Protein of unknown function, DUF547
MPLNSASPRLRPLSYFAWSAAACLLIMFATSVTSVQARDVTKTFDAYAKGAAGTVDHAVWSKLLMTSVIAGSDGVNRIRYKEFGAASRADLAAYIKSLESVDPATLDRPEQLAFWINLYNAVTLHAVVAKYPVKSINDVDLADPTGASGGGPWKAQLTTVANMKLSLDDIENQIVRPIFKDARAHYGLNCLSIGCPNLQIGAFTGRAIEAQLDTLTRAFVNHPRALAVRDGKVEASSIYEWFVEDFGGFAGVLAHLDRYAEPALKARLGSIKQFDSYAYDWALADAAP